MEVGSIQIMSVFIQIERMCNCNDCIIFLLEKELMFGQPDLSSRFISFHSFIKTLPYTTISLMIILWLEVSLDNFGECTFKVLSSAEKQYQPDNYLKKNKARILRKLNFETSAMKSWSYK